MWVVQGASRPRIDRIQPTFAVCQEVYEDLPMAQLSDHFDDIMSAGYSVSLFTDWRKGRVSEVWVKRRVEEQPADLTRYGARRASRNLHPIIDLSPENCTEQMGVPGPWFDRLPHFRMGFTPSSGKELQAEYFVPREHAVDAILAVERLRDRITPHLFISEIRTIDADDLWISPCYKQPSVTIHFTWKPEPQAVLAVLPDIQKALEPFGARPHWGKVFTTDPTYLHKQYAALDHFRAFAREMDQHARTEFPLLRGVLRPVRPGRPDGTPR